MRNEKYILCVDLGNQQTKYTTINDSDNLGAFYTIPLFHKKNDNMQELQYFIGLLSTTYENYLKQTNFYGNNIIESKNGLIKLEYLDRTYYPEELAAKLLETVKYKIENKLNAENFVENIILTKNIPLVTAIAGLNLTYIPEETAILYAYKKLYKTKNCKPKRNILAIDLGATALKIHYYKNLKHGKTKIYTDWTSNEFTIVLNNRIKQTYLKNFPGLSSEEKITLLNNVDDLNTGGASCSPQIINRLIYRVKQVRNDVEIKEVDEIILIGAAAKMVILKNAIRKCLQTDICDINMDPEFFIIFGLSAIKTKINH